VVVHATNPSTWETRAGGFSVWGQLWLHSETLSIINKVRKKDLGNW
jgi:hypothetical protein